jgi:oligopeptide transport system ATP-binding protein
MARVLEIDNLNTRFDTPDGEVSAVNDLSLFVDEGESLGIVGESGSGKTQVFLSAMGLLARNGRARGSVRFRGREILGAPARELDRLRGARVAMVFQDPMTSLNPYLTISRQMTEVLMAHRGVAKARAREQAIEFLDRVGIPAPRQRIDRYPHELSGGMRQRVMIAMALLCEPDLLIADEPTTALDVTIQAQILELLMDLKGELNTAIVLITHDLGVVAGLCDRVMILYAGRIAEQGPVREVFYHPRHPYTRGLLNAIPRLDAADARALETIPGQPPNRQRLPAGCVYRARCPYAFQPCGEALPVLRRVANGHEKACHLDPAPP